MRWLRAGIDESALGVVVDADAEGALASLAQLLKTPPRVGAFRGAAYILSADVRSNLRCGRIASSATPSE